MPEKSDHGPAAGLDADRIEMIAPLVVDNIAAIRAQGLGDEASMKLIAEQLRLAIQAINAHFLVWAEATLSKMDGADRRPWTHINGANITSRTILDSLLADIERQAQAILMDICLGPGTVEASAFLKRERPWPNALRQRDIPRRIRATMSLVLVTNLRDYLAWRPGSELAAVLALTLGLHSFDHGSNSVRAEQSRQTARRGGAARGQKLARTATRMDLSIRESFHRWAKSDELQGQYRSAVPYIAKKLGLSCRTIQRRLKRLGLSPRTRQ